MGYLIFGAADAPTLEGGEVVVSGIGVVALVGRCGASPADVAGRCSGVRVPFPGSVEELWFATNDTGGLTEVHCPENPA